MEGERVEEKQRKIKQKRANSKLREVGRERGGAEI